MFDAGIESTTSASSFIKFNLEASRELSIEKCQNLERDVRVSLQTVTKPV